MSLLSAVKAARKANVDPRTMRLWVRQQIVPSLGFEACGRIFVREEVLLRFLSGELRLRPPDRGLQEVGHG